MRSASAKTVPISEKEAEPDVLNNTSLCSCVQCDSHICLARRNRTPCSCDKFNFKDQIKDSKSSSQIFKVSFHNMDSFVNEFTYDYSTNNINTTHPSNSSCASSNTKNHIKKRSMGSTELSNSKIQNCKEFDHDSNTAKLSAQIMNLPYREFKDTISQNKSDNNNTSKLPKIDIFRRIKDVYKACSCKVCECIVGKATTNDFCKCKPCECHDCVALSNNLKFGVNHQLGSIICSCTRCNRKECKGLVKKSLSEPSYCDVGICECITCLDNFNEPCNCTPCECIECKSYSTSKPRTVIVGRMGEDAPRNLCACSPCECAECGQNYPVASSLRREMSTGISRPTNCNCDSCLSQSCETDGNNTCMCEIQKRLMRKPVEKDTRDYDIHRASINNNNLIEKPKSNTIAMYTALGKYAPTFEQLGDACYCSECECIVCSGKDETANAIKASRLFEPLKETPSELNNDTCNCLPCECEVCSEHHKNIGRDLKSCTCDVCDCLKCEGLMRLPQKNNKDINKKVIKSFIGNICKCKPCQCADCKSMMYNCTGPSCCCSNCKCEVCIDKSKRVTSVKFESNKNYSKPNNNDYHSDSNERKKVCNKKEYVKFFNKGNIPKSAKEMNKMNKRKNFENEAFMKNEKADFLFFDGSNSDISNVSESFTSKSSKSNLPEYLNDESTPKSETIKSKTKNGMYTPERHNIVKSSSISNINKCIHEVMNPNLEEYINTIQLNIKENIVPNQYVKETFKEQSICNNSDSMKVLTMAHAEINSKIDIEKPSIIENHISDLDSTWDLKEATKRDSRKQISNMKKMSQEIAQSLRDANRKYAYVKCKNSETHYEITSEDFTAKDLSQKIVKQPVPKNIVRNNDLISSKIIDFEKIYFNLQQAKAFSLELLSILRQYQNANKNLPKTFKVDCSKRLHSDVGITNCKENETHKAPVRVQDDIQESRQLKSNLPSEVMKNKNDNFIFDREPIYNLRQETYGKNIFQGDTYKKRHNFHATLNNDYTVPTTSNNTELIDYLLNGNDKEPFQSMYNQSYVTNPENTQLHRMDVNDYTKGGIKTNSKSFLNPKLKLNPVVDSIAYNNTSRFRHDELSETLVPSKESDIKQSLGTPRTYSLQTRNFETFNKISNPFVKNGLAKHKECLSTSTSTVTLDRSDNILNELQEISGATEIKHWSILKKNMNLYNSPFIKNKGLSFIPTLTLEVKNVLRSISGQFNNYANGETSTNVPVTKAKVGDNTLSEMEFQDQNYFIAASSQTFELAMIEEKGINCRKEESSGSIHTSKHAQNLTLTTSYHKSLESPKSSCEAMKANFLGLRRVSDHTVLVKWKVPKDITSVQGYELLVDGRAVQKILSPARCMAVVSCLPHLDQVLITIRTIVTQAQQYKYLPTATVVYHPRIR